MIEKIQKHIENHGHDDEKVKLYELLFKIQYQSLLTPEEEHQFKTFFAKNTITITNEELQGNENLVFLPYIHDEAYTYDNAQYKDNILYGNNINDVRHQSYFYDEQQAFSGLKYKYGSNFEQAPKNVQISDNVFNIGQGIMEEQQAREKFKTDINQFKENKNKTKFVTLIRSGNNKSGHWMTTMIEKDGEGYAVSLLNTNGSIDKKVLEDTNKFLTKECELTNIQYIDLGGELQQNQMPENYHTPATKAELNQYGRSNCGPNASIAMQCMVESKNENDLIQNINHSNSLDHVKTDRERVYLLDKSAGLKDLYISKEQNINDTRIQADLVNKKEFLSKNEIKEVQKQLTAFDNQEQLTQDIFELCKNQQQGNTIQKRIANDIRQKIKADQNTSFEIDTLKPIIQEKINNKLPQIQEDKKTLDELEQFAERGNSYLIDRINTREAIKFDQRKNIEITSSKEAKETYENMSAALMYDDPDREMNNFLKKVANATYSGQDSAKNLKQLFDNNQELASKLYAKIEGGAPPSNINPPTITNDLTNYFEAMKISKGIRRNTQDLSKSNMQTPTTTRNRSQSINRSNSLQ